MKTLCAICDNCYVDQRSLSDSQDCRQHCDKNISVDGIKQHLEYGVKPHQGGAVLGAAAGQLIPDDDHGNAASQTDEDYAVHEVRRVSQEDYRQCKHQDGTNDPVLYQGEAEDFFVLEDLYPALHTLPWPGAGTSSE